MTTPTPTQVKYTKPGATFNNGLEAYQDKNSLYPAEIVEKLEALRQSLITDNIMVEETYEWDQATYTLTITRTFNDLAAAAARIQDPDSGWNPANYQQYSIAAGWELVQTISYA